MTGDRAKYLYSRFSPFIYIGAWNDIVYEVKYSFPLRGKEILLLRNPHPKLK